MTNIRIATDLVLPLEFTTQAVGVIAKRRAGKSYLSRRIAEQLLKAGQQVVIADPKGDWWGVRSSSDGKGPGFPVIILGGEHGDLPLEVKAGEVVAKMVVEDRVSVLLDLSDFRKHEVATFMTPFMETLYRLKAKEVNRTPLMFIVDEADAIAPQKPNPGEERMLGAAEDIVRRGGQRGIGCMMITQRTAVLNKNVLTQCEVLVALRTIAPQDLKAMQAWIDVHGSDEERKELMGSLPSLPVGKGGKAWFWSPGWPSKDGIFQLVQPLPIETFDSGATPKSGEKRVEPKNMADVDLGALQRQMADTIEKAKADDPKELRKEIAGLKKQLAAKAGVVVDEAAVERAREDGRAMADLQHRATMKGALKNVQDYVKLVDGGAHHLQWALDSLQTSIDQTVPLKGATKSPGQVLRPPPSRERQVPARPKTAPTGDGSVSGVGQKILDTLAGFEALGVMQPDKATVAAMCDYHPNAKSYSNAMGSLRTGGYVDYPPGGRLALTPAGRAIATSSLPVSSVDELHEMWYAKLGNVAEKILRPILEAYPNAVSAETVAREAGYHPNAKSFSNMKGRLRTLGLIDYPSSGQIIATDILFPQGL